MNNVWGKVNQLHGNLCMFRVSDVCFNNTGFFFRLSIGHNFLRTIAKQSTTLCCNLLYSGLLIAEK